MKRSRTVAVPVLVASFTLLNTAQAMAQGTMTPSQPPGTPNQPPTGTPNQPPPNTPNEPPPVVQPARPAPRQVEGPEEGEGASDAPKARTGFQMSIRPGIAIPAGSIGDAANGNGTTLKLSDYVGPQFSTTLDIGAKIIPNLFIGGYFGLGLGGAGGTTGDTCTKANVSCTAITLRLGIEAQFHILPDQRINPWVGYGIGFEASTVSNTSGSGGSSSASGVEFAHLMGGVDFRLSRIFGVGPFLDLAVGQYSSVNNGIVSADIQNKALHEWLTIGGKLTFWP